MHIPPMYGGHYLGIEHVVSSKVTSVQRSLTFGPESGISLLVWLSVIEGLTSARDDTKLVRFLSNSRGALHIIPSLYSIYIIYRNTGGM